MVNLFPISILKFGFTSPISPNPAVLNLVLSTKIAPVSLIGETTLYNPTVWKENFKISELFEI